MTPDPLAAVRTSPPGGKPRTRRLPPRAARPGPSEPEGFRRAFNRLCHLVPLTQTGKVPEVVDSLVLTCFGMDASVPFSTPASVVGALDAYFGVELDAADVQQSIDRHLLAGRLLRTAHGGRLVLALDARAEVEQRIEEGNRLEEAVRAEWTAELLGAGRTEPEAELMWGCLRTYMAKAFCQHGALTVQLLDPNAPAPATELVSLRALLDAAVAESCPTLDPEMVGQSVSGFFETSSSTRSRYVAQMLDATFTFFALRVDEATAAYLRGTLAPLKLFLDTNFIFGLLDLHVNPLREVSKELIAFIQAQGFPYKLYYHERTLKELRETIDRVASRLRARRWSPALSRAACTLPYVTGLELAYHRKNAESPVDVEVFLSKFDHIEELLADFGVKLYRVPRHLTADIERKSLLIADYLAYAGEHRPGRPKAYESADHDMTVLMTLDELRQKGKSALDVGALFLSADYLLWEFDRSQLRGRGEVVRVVLPAQLLQLLRPFANSSEDFDQRFVEAFAVPAFRAAHGDYRETTSMVLSYLATYGDLPEQTAVRILTDELLLGRLKGVEEDSAEFAEIMERALEEDHVQLAEEHQALKARFEDERTASGAAIADAQRQLDAHAGELERVTSDADTRIAEAREEERARADEQVRAVEAQKQQVERQVTALQRRLDAEDERRARRRRWLRYGEVIVGWLMVTVAAVIVPHVVQWHWLLHHDHQVGIYLGFYLVTGGVAWTAAKRSHWKGALGVVALGALVALIGVL